MFWAQWKQNAGGQITRIWYESLILHLIPQAKGSCKPQHNHSIDKSNMISLIFSAKMYSTVFTANSFYTNLQAYSHRNDKHTYTALYRTPLKTTTDIHSVSVSFLYKIKTNCHFFFWGQTETMGRLMYIT